MFGIFVHYSTRPIYDVSMNLFCRPPSVDIFNNFARFSLTTTLKYRTIFLPFNFLLNPSAPKCLKNRFQLLSVSRGPLGHLTTASLYDLKVPYPHSNSGKRTLAYSASKHFNDLNSDLREYFTASSPRTSKSLNSILSSIKCQLGNLFLSRLSSTEHLEHLLLLN